MTRPGFALLLFSFSLYASDPGYEHEIGQFRELRQAEIAGENGWITIAGLFWLKNGENHVGSDESSEIVLPASAPKHAGVIIVNKEVDKDSVRFVSASGATVDLSIDSEKRAVIIGSVKFFVIRRSGKLAVRVKDSESPARKKFTGLKWYPIDPSWRFEAKFTPWRDKRSLTFSTVAGIKEHLPNPGYVTFFRNGQEYRLEPAVEENKLFFVIRDRTSGKTTYGGARFLYAEIPETGLTVPGTVLLDFNAAVNPPCMFTPYATCPLPPPQNRLPIEVTAGEKLYGTDHGVH
jgi:uncharacterized protein